MKRKILLMVLAGMAAVAFACKSGADHREQIIQKIKAFNNFDAKVKWNAIGKLSTYKQEAVPELVAALQNDNSDVRWCAAATLALIGPGAKDALPQLQKLMSGDKDAAVREMSQLACNKIGGNTIASPPETVRITTEDSTGIGFSVPSEAMLQRLRAEIDLPE